MAIVAYPQGLPVLIARGKFGFGRGYGGSQYGYMRYGFEDGRAGANYYGRLRYGSTRQPWLGGLSGIYQRKRVGVGSTLPPYKRGNRWAISRMAHYRPTNNQLPGQQAWRGVFADGMAQYALLTTDEKTLLSKEARKTRMLGFNLFMQRWLQEHRT